MKLSIRKPIILLTTLVVSLIAFITISVLFFTSFCVLISNLKELNISLSRTIGKLIGTIIGEAIITALLGTIIGAILGAIKKKALKKKGALIGIAIIMITRGITTWTLIGALIGQSTIKGGAGTIAGGGIGIIVGIAIAKKAWEIATKTNS